MVDGCQVRMALHRRWFLNKEMQWLPNRQLSTIECLRFTRTILCLGFPYYSCIEAGVTFCPQIVGSTL